MTVFQFVFQLVALPADLNDMLVVEQSVQNGSRQRFVVAKGARPLRERQVAYLTHN
ncbi:hypothetical protein PXZ44_001249 [Salmonella enterica]|uniref:Uncharacterized protein n=1 Tax=Salmonella enterica TaxID=28901 RepID=A0A8E6QLZ5_SALER|nr:hypothetical protein [Salmonella enterica]EKB3222942.1 hypothetical protein [Salmonella enterica subsp. enterica serovar Gaminara]EKV6446992.1 hypothetical protein [Klebsiella oxytoca]EIB3588212.1 hypothetical protein [Salmonella enterica]EIE0585174.1 hypothetical protein [Salmonella enterica]